MNEDWWNGCSCSWDEVYAIMVESICQSFHDSVNRMTESMDKLTETMRNMP
jgi:hypothetical protein